MRKITITVDDVTSLSARRAWIEMCFSRSPFAMSRLSLSARRAWIEMPWFFSALPYSVSLSARRAWIEMNIFRPVLVYLTSLSARRAWIEIEVTRNAHTGTYVALRKESVDRNRGC